MTRPWATIADHIIRGGAWALIYIFILSYLHPELILNDSVAAGGDTASHFYTAVYLKEQLLTHGRLAGWCPGNYAGFPMFQMYFPLPFLLMVGLSLVMPLAVSFKVVTVLGIFMLPLACSRFLKALGYGRQTGDLGAICVLAFLFMETNSAWGGNIPSTLAGEFCYSLGLSLGLIYLGRMFQDIDANRHGLSNAVLLALVGLCHGYPLLFCVTGAGFFLLTTSNWVRRLAYILEVNLLAFGLMGFWIVPLLAFTPYTTPFNFVWEIKGLKEVIPSIIWPLAGLGGVYAVLHWFRPGRGLDHSKRISYFVYLVGTAILFYFTAFRIGVVDIRFLPFAQLFAVLLGAVAVGRLVGRFRAQSLAILAVALAMVAWTGYQETYIKDWAAWNFSGWQEKPLWPAFRKVVEHLDGDFSQPRVVYEHAGLTEAAGTVRAFESLPWFAGRATLEGVYIQASLSAPMAFYIQSQVSQSISAPLNKYNYSRFDLARARGSLKLFNVSQYITVTRASRQAALATPGYRLEASFPPFAIFSVEGIGDKYVVEPRFQPVAVLSEDPKRDGFEWFRWTDLEVPVVLSREVKPDEKGLFAEVIEPSQMRKLVHRKFPQSGGIRETIHNDEIIIEGATPGVPLWIKVSYHPNWQVEGAPKVWRSGPAFMLVVPDSDRVRLLFGRGWPDYLGALLSLMAWCYVAATKYAEAGRPSFGGNPRWHGFLSFLLRPLTGPASRWRRLVLLSSLTVLAAIMGYMIFAAQYQDPAVYFRKGLSFYDRKDYGNAREYFAESVRRFPWSPSVDQSLHHLALTYFNEDKYPAAREVWESIERDYPESRLLETALYHIVMTYHSENRITEARPWIRKLTTMFPGSIWAEKAWPLLGDSLETSAMDGQ